MYTKWLQEVTLATDIIIICSKSFLKKSVNPNTVPTTKTSDVVNICCTEKLWCDWCLGRRNLICPVPSVPSRFPLDSICFSLLHSPAVCNKFSLFHSLFDLFPLCFLYFLPNLMSHSTSSLLHFLLSFLLSLIKPIATRCVSVCASWSTNCWVVWQRMPK